MLRWKTHKFSSISAGEEELYTLLSGVTDKRRRIRYVTPDQNDAVYLRVYRDTDMVVELESDLLTSSAPHLPVDIPVEPGQKIDVGFYNGSGSTVTNVSVAIGYDEE